MARRRSRAGPRRRAELRERAKRLSSFACAGRPRSRASGGCMSLLVKGKRTGREIVTVTPQSAGWRHVGFAAQRLARGERLTFDTGSTEVCIMVLTGIVIVGIPDLTSRETGAPPPAFVLSSAQ